MGLIVGLDLGQAQDPSALAIIDHQRYKIPMEGERTLTTHMHQVRHLQRWQLGTSYVQIVEDLKTLFSRLMGNVPVAAPLPPRDRPGVWTRLGKSVLEMLTPEPPPPIVPPGEPVSRPVLVVDCTGIGAAVVDMIRAAQLPARSFGVLITSGSEVTGRSGGWNVPKKDIVATLQSALQQQRLQIARGLKLARELRKELARFKAKISTSGVESYEAWRSRDHDDICLATGLSVWFAERKCRSLDDICF